MSEWYTSGHDERASREGWNVFTDDSTGRLEVQRLDNPPDDLHWREGDPTEPMFDGDDSALAFVQQRANEGAPHAVEALRLIADKTEPAT